MADATSDFFAALGRRGFEPLLYRANGTLRIDLTDGRKTESWVVASTKGNVSVSRGGGPADCVVRCKKALFERLASGLANPQVALLRGEVTLEGDYNLVVLFQRLFPGPRRSGGRRATSARRKA